MFLFVPSDTFAVKTHHKKTSQRKRERKCFHDHDWTTKTSLSSDCLPIIISIPESTPTTWSPKRTFVNLAKANWLEFTTETESLFSNCPLPTNIHTAEYYFRKVINRASGHHIPTGRIPKMQPFFPRKASELAAERDSIRATDPQSPRIAELTTQIQQTVDEHKRAKWLEHLATFDRHVGLPKLWKTVKSLNQGPTTPSNQSISFNGKPESDARKIAAKFNKQFTSIIKHSSSRTVRILTRKIKSRSNTGLPNFTSGDTAKTVKQAKASKSFGPDNTSTLYLKHLGPAGVDYLTTMYNLSLASSEIPSLWKMSKILPSLKAGKDLFDSKSYRPISVLCPAIKILERLLLPILDQHLPNSTIAASNTASAEVTLQPQHSSN